MFKIGDKIIYPMQGAGIIDRVEEKEISQVKCNYFIINMVNNSMQVMIPKDKISTSGIRPISDEETLELVLQSFTTNDAQLDDALNYKERYQTNLRKVKSGDLKEGSEVVRDLLLLNSKKPLNSSEKQMLNTAKKLLVGEISLIKNISEAEASSLINSVIS
ncbi:CarD family transcriptional regulator [Clostridium zeae]|uniref:CarD family transcriptional regulator n=1 Tax=Clostridium zeae TaxID=2759022 RepID=A0ABQ1E7J3_9CLOT|nr:CarD family transcriptional regulator [Clostridium zeae]GFZ30690.1 CarD family transcriptional regulator [Clostridium zeae]